jgi:hypothetical protein
LAPQAIEVLIATAPLTGKWPGKVGGVSEMLINQKMPCNLFAVVKSKMLHPRHFQLS